MSSSGPQIEKAIVGYHTDEQGHWVAELECGHFQHVRHDPPWMVREWVTSPSGRQSMLGYRLDCKKCAQGEPPDQSPNSSGDSHRELPES